MQWAVRAAANWMRISVGGGGRGLDGFRHRSSHRRDKRRRACIKNRLQVINLIIRVQSLDIHPNAYLEVGIINRRRSRNRTGNLVVCVDSKLLPVTSTFVGGRQLAITMSTVSGSVHLPGPWNMFWNSQISPNSKWTLSRFCFFSFKMPWPTSGLRAIWLKINAIWIFQNF